MKEGFLQERGISYRTNTFEPGRTTLLFIHGLSGSSSAWLPYEKEFETHYNVITFDLRGHGLSLRPEREEYAMEKFVEDIRELLTFLAVDRCTVVSHSFGTLIAMKFAQAHPHLVERMILLAPAYDVQSFRTSKLLTNLAAAFIVAPIRMPNGRRTNYARFYPTPDWSARRIGTDILNMGIRSYLRCMQIIFAHDYTPDWTALTQPVLIVHGGKDSIVPVEHSHRLVKILPHATLVELADANHILVLNNAPEVIKEIESFIS
jgi:pimeloyl-ACP methyl ester carboxylesterase